MLNEAGLASRPQVHVIAFLSLFHITCFSPDVLVCSCFLVNPQVNAGPLAYAQAFLDKSVMASHPHKHIEKLQQVYRCVS